MSLGNREKFLQLYANLPLGVRQEIIVVNDAGQPLTWNAVYVEVQAETEESKALLEKLNSIGII